MKRFFGAAISAFALAAIMPAWAVEPDLSKGTMPIAEMLDPAIAPCDDFYKHVCSKWQAANPIPADRQRWGGFNILAESNIIKLKTIIDDATKSHAKDGAKIVDYYAACMDEAGIEQADLLPILPILGKIDALKDKGGIALLLAEFHSLGRPALFGFGSQTDPKDSTHSIATLSQGGLGLPDRDYYLKTDERSVKLREAYLAHVTAQFVNVGYTPDSAAVLAKNVVSFETALAEISLERVKQRDPNVTYNLTAVSDLAKMAPGIDWAGYFAKVEAPSFDKLNIRTIDYVKNVSSVLDKAPLDDIKAYMTWGVVRTAAAALPKRFVDENFKFYGKTLGGAQEILPRWRRCVQATDQALGEDLGKKFIDRYFPSKAKEQTIALVREVRTAFDERIGVLDWMGNATKAKAKEKLKSIDENLGYPNKWKSYDSVLIRRDDYAGNNQRAFAFEHRRNLNKIGTPVDRGEWGMTPPTVNAYYRPSMNDINFPAGILQPPFFDPDLDPAVNFGAIGLVIGHEITHGFDDQGSKYDAKGNLTDWWSADDRKNFDEREQCLVDQYGSYVADGEVKLNGKLTLGENTADNGGARISYLALKQLLAKMKGGPKIDGLTPEQRFFVGFARVWCGNDRPEGRRLQAQTDPHSPGDYRVNGTVSNMPEFAAAFQCKPGDKMVRANACKIW
jgi:endothelin-converting enzyme/putative endopeptidase